MVKRMGPQPGQKTRGEGRLPRLKPGKKQDVTRTMPKNFGG